MTQWRARRSAQTQGALLLAFTTALVACRENVPAASAPPLILRAPPAKTTRVVSIPTARHAEVTRHDVVIRLDIEEAITRRGLPPSILDALDDAFVARLDLFAHASPGRRLSVWTQGDEVVAAKLGLKGGSAVIAALYDGELAPRGFYDGAGHSMRGTLLARPVALRRITSRFGQRMDVFSGKPGSHRGIDYGVPRGTDVAAVGRARVARIGSTPSAGNFIKLAHSDGYESFYLHLDAVDDAIKVGSVVEQGQRIALSGNTGRSTGPHLHYELHLAGIPVDPLAVLPMPQVVLGPIARRQHLAFINNLEAIRDRRTDE